MGQAYRLGRGVLVDLATAQTWLERAAQQGPCRRSDDARSPAFPERPAGGGPEMAEAGGRKRRPAIDACLRHRLVQRRRRRRRTRCLATPMSAARPRRGLSLPRARWRRWTGSCRSRSARRARPRHAKGEDAAETEGCAKSHGCRRPAKAHCVDTGSRKRIRRRMADPAWSLLSKGVGRSAFPQVVRKRARRGPPVVPSRRWQRNASPGRPLSRARALQPRHAARLSARGQACFPVAAR